MSKSVFSSRIHQIVGEPPIVYLAKAFKKMTGDTPGSIDRQAFFKKEFLPSAIRAGVSLSDPGMVSGKDPKMRVARLIKVQRQPGS